ncbi:fimbria/pilus chaperone family protein [Lysobacter sp. GCM10012299]|uniref:fimbria/pilus chaperone family protein n=1 Tax=Lysobacter sp. GCM10012299 TaxID=3317333 RepID=UPI003611762C
MVVFTSFRCWFVGGLLAFGCPASVWADGMIPETSVVIVNEVDGEGSLKVTNSDSTVALLHVAVENVPEDTESLVFVTPQLARVEAGKQQLVRFVLLNKVPLKVQRLKRVILEGIPPQREKGEGAGAKIGLGVRQNLPVLINPRGLKRNQEPWTGLQWSVEGGALRVRNDTAYVVRLAQSVHLLPSQAAVNLPRTYVLPGDDLKVPLPAGATATAVRLYPATVYGYAVDAYEAPITPAAVR